MEYVLDKEEIEIVRDVIPLVRSLSEGLPLHDRLDKTAELIMNGEDSLELSIEQRNTILLMLALQELSFRKKYNVLTRNYGIELNSERLTCIAQAITRYGS